jgi:hypothetical protein
VVFARWQSQNAGIAYVRRQHSVTSPIPESASVSVGFAVDTTVLRPAMSAAAPTRCQDPYGLGSGS